MPDNIGYTPGAGATVAADDIDDVKYQRIKLVLGADGVNGGDVAADNPMPVQDPNAGGLLSRILQVLLSPLGYDKSLQRNRVTAVLESGTVTAVTTVATVTNLSTIDTLQARLLVNGQNVSAWQACVRSRIS